MFSGNDPRAEDGGVQGQTHTVHQYGNENSSVQLANASQDGDVDLSLKVAAALDAAGVPVDESQVDGDDTDVDVEAPVVPPEDHGSGSGGVLRFLFGGGEPRHEEGQPQDKREPMEEAPAAASEVSTVAAKSGSDSRDNDTLTSVLFGPSSKDKVVNEAAAESTSEQSEHDKDDGNDKNDGGFAVMIAEKLDLIPSDDEKDKIAAGAAADADAGPTEETPVAASEDSTPAAKSDSDSSDSESTSDQSEQDKDNDKNDGDFAARIAEKLGLMPSEEKEEETAAIAAAADAGAGPTEETVAAASEVSTPVAKSDSDVTSPLKESSEGLSRDNDTLTSMLFGPSPEGKVANEAAAESTSKQSEQDKDKSVGGLFVTIAEKLDLIPSDDEKDKTAAAAAAADADAGPTEEILAAASEDSTPAAKSDSDSSDSESTSDQSEQDKDNDKDDGGFAVRIAEKLGLMPLEEKEEETAAIAAAADAGAGPTEETVAAASEVSTPVAKSDSDVTSPLKESSEGLSRDNDTLTSMLFGPSPEGKVDNEAAAESTSKQSEQYKEKNVGGFFEMIAEKLDLIPSDDEKDKTAAAAADADADAGPTEETLAAASEVSTPAAKSVSDVTSPLKESSAGLSKDNDTLTSMLFGPSSTGMVANEAAVESTSKQSEQDKDSDKNDGGFFGMIAEKLDLIPSDDKDETAAAAADADAGVTT